jgi:enediyne biosynthesis protein E4
MYPIFDTRISVLARQKYQYLDGELSQPLRGTLFSRLAQRGVAAALCAMLAWPAVAAGQGMGSPRRTVPQPARVETDLPPITVDFRDVAREAGLTAANVSGGEAAKKYILEATGNGVALFDFDNDGLLDVFLVNATTLDRDGPGASATSHLYRNLGRLRFEDVTERAGLSRVAWGQGVCVGDYDNDGHRDLFVTYYGQSLLYRNQGNGTFGDVTAAAGLRADAQRWDTGCSFVDYDLDGRLDLVVTSYLEFDRAKVPEPGAGGYCTWKGIPVMCGPRGLPFSRNRLFHNDGKGRFTDVSMASGIGTVKGCYGFTVVASDFDGDAFPDLYVACDSTPSLLYRNQRNGTFEENGLLAGVALNEDGQEQGGMGVAVADYDEDGDTDIAKTNFSDDIPNLYHNNGDGTFEDRVLRAGLGGSMQYVGWGVHFIDVDHDGRKDLLMVNGHVYPEAEKTAEIKFRQPRLLYWHVNGGRFKDISRTSGAGIAVTQSSRGSAAGDLDNDGSLEVVISNLGGPPSLLKNFGPRKNWLLVQCVGTKANRDALGARVYVHASGRRLSGEIQSGASFISQNDSRVHLGVGDEARYDRIEVLWPGGNREIFPGGAANRIVTLTQGTGRGQIPSPPRSGEG